MPVALLVLIIALLAAMGSVAQTDPPASGDWTVADKTFVGNTTVDLRGNLTVANGGNLTLHNVTLRIHSNRTNPLGVLVKAGGSLYTFAYREDHTIIMRGSPSWGYSFEVEKGAVIDAYRTIVSGSGSSRGTKGLLVRADNASFDFVDLIDGYQYGLRAVGCEGLTVRRSNITRASLGVVLDGTRNASVRSCRVVKNTQAGIRATGCVGTVVSWSNVSDNGIYGIQLSDCNRTSIGDSTIEGNPWGVHASGVRHFNTTSCTLGSSDFETVMVKGPSSHVRFTLVTVSGSGRSAIRFNNADNVTLFGCNITNASYYGIHIENGSRDILVSRSNVSASGYDGIHIERTVRLRILRDKVHENGYNGVFLIDCQNVSVEACTFASNRFDGLNCDQVHELEVERLEAVRNGYNGLYMQAGSQNASLVGCRLVNNTRSGLCLDSAFNVTATGCNLSANARSGVHVESGSRHVDLAGCRMLLNTDEGVYVERSSRVRLEGCRVTTPPGPGTYTVFSSGGWELWVLNCTLNGTVRANRDGNVSVVDPEVETFKAQASTGSWVDLAYWVTVEVVWPDMDPVRGARVNATSSDGNRNRTAITDGAGLAAWMPVTSRSWEGGLVLDRNPVTFRVTKGDESVSRELNVTANTTIRIVLQDDVPPTAVAPDVVAELGFEVILDGSGSRDNGEIATWVWTFDDGVGVVVLEGEYVTWTFHRLGNLTGQLNVTDSVGLYHVVGFTIHVVDTMPPTLPSMGNLTVDQHQQVELDGTNTTDNDGTLLTTGTFTWSVHDARTGTLVGTREGPLETWAFHLMGVYRVVLEVIDQSGNAANGTLWVHVLDTEPPVLGLGEDLEVDQGTSLVLEPVVLEDNDPAFADGAEYEWTLEDPWGPPTTSFDPTLDVTLEGMGTYVVSLAVTDPSGNRAVDSVIIIVRDTTPPSALAGEDLTVEVGTGVDLSGSGTTDNDPAFPEGARYRWSVTGPELDVVLRGTNVSFSPPWIGEYTCVLTVTDAAGNSGTDALRVRSMDTGAPVFGSFSPGPDVLHDQGQLDVTLVVLDEGTGVDPSTLEMRTMLAGAVNWSGWVALGAEGGGNRWEVTFPLEVPEGTSRVQLRCADAVGNGVISPEHVLRVNSRPVLRLLSPPEGADYGPYDEVMLDASSSFDVDGNDTLYFTWSSDVDGPLTMGPRQTAPRLSAGDHVITVTVTDGIPGHEVLAIVNITVRPVPSTVPGDEGPPWIWIGVLALSALLLAVVLFDVRRRRGGGTTREGGERIAGPPGDASDPEGVGEPTGPGQGASPHQPTKWKSLFSVPAIEEGVS